MSVRLVTEKPVQGICVNDMQDGQLAVILAWDFCEYRVRDRIVQRCGDDAQAHLVTLGEPSTKSFSTIFVTRHEDCRVRLLKAPDRIEIVHN